MHSNSTTIKTSSDGVWQGDNPLNYAFPLLIVQTTLVLFVSRFLAFLLKPLRQPKVIAEIIVCFQIKISFFHFMHVTIFPEFFYRYKFCFTFWHNLHIILHQLHMKATIGTCKNYNLVIYIFSIINNYNYILSGNIKMQMVNYWNLWSLWKSEDRLKVLSVWPAQWRPTEHAVNS